MKHPRILTLVSIFTLWGLGAPPAPGGEPALSWLENTPQPRPVEGPSPAEIRDAMEQGKRFLLQAQNRNGSWGSATSTKELNIYAPVPGAHHAFRAAVTSLAISALFESLQDGQELAGEEAEAILAAETWLMDELPKVRRANHDALYNVWAHAFSIDALVHLIRYHESRDESVARHRALIQSQINLLRRYESLDNGWGYYDFGAHTKRPNTKPTSFTTATVLVALKTVQDAGIEVPQDLVQHAQQSLRRMQKPDFSYYYSFSGPTTVQPMRSINRPGGSLGRSQACNLALRLWGDPAITDQVLDVWLDRLFARNLWLDLGRKRPIPHESHFLVAGYFFYYGHWYGARCIEQLPADERQPHRDQMARIIVDLQEANGSWWDYPFYAYHEEYGTAMAMMTLARCLPEQQMVVGEPDPSASG